MTSTLFAAIHGVSAVPLGLPTIAWPKLETIADLILEGMLSAWRAKLAAASSTSAWPNVDISVFFAADAVSETAKGRTRNRFGTKKIKPAQQTQLAHAASPAGSRSIHKRPSGSSINSIQKNFETRGLRTLHMSALAIRCRSWANH